MKKIVLLLALCFFGYAADANAQGFLKGLKDKAEKAVQKVEKNLDPTKKSKKEKADKSEASGNAASKVGQVLTGNEDGNTMSPTVGLLHHGSVDDFSMSVYENPKITSSTKRVHVQNETRAVSNFSDGVAYIYSAPKEAFYIDKNGNKLFDTEIYESIEERMPAFCDGVVLEFDRGIGKNTATIRDKKGNVIKKFEGIRDASRFIDGVAVLREEKGLGKPDSYKYIDTKGNYIFPEISFSAVTGPGADVVMRQSSDGLTAFPKVEGRNTLWGFRDASGKVVIEPKFDGVSDFSDGMAAYLAEVNGNKLWGFIDKTGKTVIEPKFTYMPSPFDSGISKVIGKDKKSYYMDKTGRFILGPIGIDSEDEQSEGQYFYISPFRDGYAIVGFYTKFPGDNYYSTVYATIDSSMRKLAWAKSLPFELRNDKYISYEGKYYYVKNFGGEDRLIQFNPRTLDLINMPETNIYIDGMLLRKGGKVGFLDEDGNLAIVIEESKF